MATGVLSIAAITVIAAVLAGTGGTPGVTAQPGSGTTGADRFAALAADNVDVDYDELASPSQAVATSDLIVTGTISGVREGVGLTFPDPVYTQRWANAYMTVVVTVDRLVSGREDLISGGTVYIEMMRNPAVSPDALAKASAGLRVVAVLTDLTDWKPAPNVTVARPDGLPTQAKLLAAYQDGFWFQGPGDQEMRGLGVEPGQLAPAWGAPKTVDQYAAAIRANVPSTTPTR
jgi:hypothetical protein